MSFKIIPFLHYIHSFYSHICYFENNNSYYNVLLFIVDSIYNSLLPSHHPVIISDTNIIVIPITY